MACIGSKCSELCGEVVCVTCRYVQTVNRFTIHPFFWKPSCICPTKSPPLLHAVKLRLQLCFRLGTVVEIEVRVNTTVRPVQLYCMSRAVQTFLLKCLT